MATILPELPGCCRNSSVADQEADSASTEHDTVAIAISCFLRRSCMYISLVYLHHPAHLFALNLPAPATSSRRIDVSERNKKLYINVINGRSA